MADVTLIQEKEVMEKLEITSRTTMWKYCKSHNFPKPVRTRPKAFLKSAFEEWLLNGGVNQKAS
ncbi:helix-turn-helix transcriptional regulator [Pantoea piersonii]|uniref:helix-turn-helix transcriptional regulator n=1 Tax=Pantoea piersonii TaxID=2364647 RepID=UPI00289F14BF|nr:AlpA family transcriptional regulator [Pantoea piersonii]